MPITQTFGFFSDTGLNTEFVGTYQLIHFTDLSDNPQDQLLYFGSQTPDREVMTATNPGVDDVELSIIDTLPEWVATTAYIEGQMVQPVGGNGYKYRCTVGGNSNSSEPTWPVPPASYGTTVVDSTVTWALISPRHNLTEVKLALTSGGLDTAVGGDPLPLGNIISSGTGNKVEVHIRIENAVDVVSANVGTPEIGLSLNAIIEVEAEV